ncbi:DUF4878 domain-containing protein [Mycolicibacterium flavescens]|uniref:DUF4878 domain-containing protein n=1 Tax=Mycolicibacterium flavescens TaxID=1776 RepID=A0A1E3RNR1_MYCFV|nr:DUF4878 domain-containing protein [Mycolicibacterium flavescens]MCV7278252.1 DUF4878 domain-containing protein [Mycolicibacterium flavescens]ODQ91508.1 DUF4878 domain-containing protein [Mycolicibacterium flavescens]
MSNPSGPDQPEDDSNVADGAGAPDESATEAFEHDADHEPATEIMSAAPPPDPSEGGDAEPGERRFTAPSGFDAGTTQRIDTPAEPATEVFAAPPGAKPVAPQMIPPRGEAPKPSQQQRRSWGWVAAVVLVIAALVAIAVLGTVLLTRDSKPKVSQEEMVRSTIEEFDAAIQSGDLAKLRGITCGSKRDSYVKYDEKTWAEIHERVAAAKQYPVVASIDQVIINGDHAEANVTAFMAYAPQTRSTRSFDLEFRDEQWKICQAPVS